MHLKSPISLLLSTLLLIHSLLASIVYVDFALHQEQITRELCLHQNAMDNFCKGDGICQLQLSLLQVEEKTHSGQQSEVKKLLIDQIYLLAATVWYTLIFKLFLPVFTQVQAVLTIGYSSQIYSPPQVA